MHKELDISGDIKKKLIADLKGFAEANPISEQEMKELAQRYIDGEKLPGFPNHTITIPTGWLVTYTIEHHPTHVSFRRLKISHDVPDLIPPQEALLLLMPEFGFTNQTNECIFFPEGKQGEILSLNVMEPVDETMEHLVARLGRLQDLKDEGIV